jgi:periplasmic protein CpxP/Spy
MKKSTLRTGLLIVLLLGNITLISNILLHKPHRPRPEGPKREIIERLHFTPEQVKEYDGLIAAHQGKIRTAEKKIRVLKNNLYANLDNAINESIVQQISQVQQQIEHIHYAHFQALKKLCKPDQLGYFKALNKDIADLFSHRMNPPRK